jgi:hypothetical protein
MLPRAELILNHVADIAAEFVGLVALIRDAHTARVQGINSRVVTSVGRIIYNLLLVYCWTL